MQVVLLLWVVCAAPMRLTATSEAKIPLGDACDLPPSILDQEISSDRNRRLVSISQQPKNTMCLPQQTDPF